MSIFISEHYNSYTCISNRCSDAPSCIWQTIENIFQVRVYFSSPQELTYDRKVAIVSLMFEASFPERLHLLQDLGWAIDHEESVAIHPKGQMYSYDELDQVLNHKLAKIKEATAVFAETIGYEGEGLNGEEIAILAYKAKNRQL